MRKIVKRLSVNRGIVASVAIAVALMWVGISALPTPAQFELDGNATVEGPGDDWANTVPSPPGLTSEAIASTFVADGSGNATIFTTGGSKDINDMNQWQWKDQAGGLPDKDNITNAYAAAYVSGTDLTIYFGADRFANDGDAQMGFWFFKQRVELNPNGTFVGPTGAPAVHSNGDVLVVLNMSNGGAQASAVAFQWLNGQLVPFASEINSALCGSNSDPNLCAISNSGSVPSPWAYTPKQGPAGSFPTFSFIEGGVNIAALIGGGGTGGCFSSFLAETRSSTSTSATLKDFALGEFNTCDMDISKTCPTVTFDPATGLLNYTSEIVVTNSGFGTVFNVTMTDTPSSPATPSTQVLASLAAGASHTFTHTFSLVPSTSSPNPPSNTATVTAATAPGGPQIIDGGSATASCPRVEFDSQLTVTKFCTTRVFAENNRVVVRVDIEGQACNVAPDPASGEFPEAVNNVVITDDPAITPINLGTLASGECKAYTSSYFPTVVLGNGLPHEQQYEDTVTAQGTGAVTAQTRTNTATANCPLCP